MIALNLIKNNLSQAIQFGSRWGVNIVLAFCLAKEQFANFSYIYAISNILMGVIPFGAAVYLLRCDRLNIDKKLEDSLSLLFFLGAIVLFLYLGLSIFLHNTESWNFIILGIMLGVVYSINYVFYSYYKCLNKFNVELYSSFFVLISSIPLVLLVYFKNDLNISIIFFYLIFLNLICTFWLCYISKIDIKNTFINLNNSSKIFLERKYYGGQEVLNTIINQFSLILLFYLLVKEDYAIFRTFLIFISPFMLFTTATGQIVLLYLKKIMNDVELLKNKILIIQILTFVFGLFVYGVMYFIYPYIFDLFDISEKYTIPFLILLTTIILRLCLSNNEMFLVVVGQQKNRFLIMLFSAVISLIIIILLTPTLGMLSAVLANLIANLILILCSTYFVFKYLRTAS